MPDKGPKLKGVLNLVIKSAKVTRNMDDGEPQDPFVAMRFINVDEKCFNKEKDKCKCDNSKPLSKF